MCVRGWVAKEEILSLVSLTSVRVSGRLHLFVYFGAKPHRKLCSREPARPEEKDEGRWLVRRETPEKRVRHPEPRTWGRSSRG